MDAFIHTEDQAQRKALDIELLVSELYKLRAFDWGGDYKNQLDKFIVDKFIKVYKNFDTLNLKLEQEIKASVRGYVFCSWYNHWSSILIEQIFKEHPAVLPAVGQIKKVDFFIENIPFDLKVTYLPANFIEAARKSKGLKPELTELKQKAKQAQILYAKNNRKSDVYNEIIEKMKDSNEALAQQALADLKKVRLEILADVIKNPTHLIKNLYQEQGEARFDASNRLFLVLVDTDDFDNSWKLKRNLNILRPNIINYLNNFKYKNKEDLQISFYYKGRTKIYQAYSDIIFITK